MRVRKVTLDDLEAIESVYRRDGRKSLKPLSKYPLIDWIMKGQNILLLAEDGDEPVGFMIIRVKGEEASIDVISVVKRLRGRIEHAFLKEALEYVTAQKVYSLAPSRASNLLKAFSELGFEVYDNVPNAFGPGRHAVKMVKILSPEQDRPPRTRLIGGGVYKKPEPGGYLELNLKKLDFLD